ncbi:MAG: outer membrane protein assembly factor BamD [Chlorobi bacterium]|nr:outer membrane protein assembly factor BamD [Chlorobiota bacterium]
MNVKHILISIFLGLSIIVITSCSEYQKLLKSSDFDAKYDKAIEYYENNDYYRAQSLLEELLTVYKGTEKAEQAYYYYAYCYYYMDDYLLAGYHFKIFAQTYPNSKYAEECSFLSAYCHYLNSPNYSLDQADTYKAIDAMQLFINKYPESKRIDTCNILIDKLRFKLETKSYNNAKLYFKLGDYKAAITTIKVSLNDFPDSEYREELMFLLLKSNFLLAENSIRNKQAERYQSTLNEYYAFIDEFPDNENIKEAEKIYEQSINNLKN